MMRASDGATTTRASALSRAGTLGETRAPRTLAECVAAKKKVERVRAWLAKGGALCASGPSGCGKASAITCAAREFGYGVEEYAAPTPTLWRERAHIENGDDGTRVEYSSKVDEFVAYCSRATKYAPLALTLTSTKTNESDGRSGGGTTSMMASRKVVLLIRDIPSSDANGRARVLEALRALAASRGGPPVAVVVTEEEERGGNRSDRSAEISAKDVRSVMEKAGAQIVDFNAATTAAITKALTRVCELEHFDMSPSDIDAIVQNSHGDVRSALGALEFWCFGKNRTGRTAPPTKRKRGEPKEAPSAVASARALLSSRDQGLGLFHALGKFLYNKRDTHDLMNIAGFETLDERLRRPPQRYNPEDVLARSGIGAETAVGFLFENFVDFVDSRSIEWVAAGERYLSDAFLLARGGVVSRGGGMGSRGGWEDVGDDEDAVLDPNLVAEYTAGSVATRGVLFSSKRSAAGFLPMRGPRAAKMERAAATNSEEVRAVVAAALEGDFSVGGTTNAVATEMLPALRLIAGSSALGASLVPFLPTKWRHPGEDDAQFTARMATVPEGVAAPRPADLTKGVAHALDRGARGSHARPLTLDDLDDMEDDIEDASGSESDDAW